MPHDPNQILSRTLYNYTKLPNRIYDKANTLVSQSLHAPVFEVILIEYDLHKVYNQIEYDLLTSANFDNSAIAKINITSSLYIYIQKLDRFTIVYGPFIEDDLFQLGVDENRVFYDEIGDCIINEIETLCDKSLTGVKRRFKRFLQQREFLMDEDIQSFIIKRQKAFEYFFEIAHEIEKINHSIEIEWLIIGVLCFYDLDRFQIVMPKVNSESSGKYTYINLNKGTLAFSSVYDSDLFQSSFIRQIGDYQKSRNLVYLEYFLVLRLWFQDNIIKLDLKNDQFNLDLFEKLCFLISRHISANTAILYRYDYSAARVSSLGVFGSSDRRKRAAQQHASDIENASDIEKKYIHVYRLKYTLEEIRIPDTEGANLFISDNMEKPKYIFLVPLIFRNKFWGVFEIHGENTFQFCDHQIRWLKELFRALTPALFDKWLLAKIYDLAETTALRSNVSVDRYQPVASIICDILLADSAAIFVQDFDRRYVYRCVSACGRPLRVNGEVISYDVRKKDVGNLSLKVHSPSAKALYVHIDDCPAEWRAKAHISELIAGGHRHFAIIPIRIGAEAPIATMTISDQSDNHWAPFWGEIVTIISEFISANIKIIFDKHYDEEIFYETRLHNIRSKALRISKTAPEIIEVINALGLGNAEKVAAFQKALDDIQITLNSAQKYGVYANRATIEMVSKLVIAVGRFSNSDQIYNSPVSDFIDEVDDLRSISDRLLSKKSDPWKTPSIYTGGYNSLRRVLLRSMKSRLMRSGGVIVAPDRHTLKSSIGYDAPRDLIANIFDNVIDNAIKYDAVGDTVQVIARVFSSRNEVQISFRNRAYILPAEVREAFGRRPIDQSEKGIYSNIEGTGLGLFQMVKLAGLWGFGIEIYPAVDRTMTDQDGREIGRHETVLRFYGDRLDF